MRLNDSQIRSLIEVNKQIISSIVLDDVLQIIIDKSTELLRLDTGAIYLIENNQLILGATTPPLPPNFPQELKYDLLSNHPHIEKAVHTGNPLSIYSTGEEIFSESEKIVVESRGLKSILYLPLFIKNKPTGILILGTTRTNRTYSEGEIDLFFTYISQSALAIENAKLHRKDQELINELQAQNKSIQEINEKLRLANERVMESDRLKSAFLANISHEIRTPLNGILGFTNIIISKELPVEKLDHYGDIIANCGKQLVTIIDDLIDISKIEANQMILNKAPVSIQSVFERLLAIYKEKTKDSRIAVSYSLNGDIEILTDEERLCQVFMNLLDNSIKFTHSGEIRFGATRKKGMVEFFAEDTGIGISECDFSKIFDRFHQVETDYTRTRGGMGLGLSITKALVELLGGNIRVQSKLGEGTTFFFTLPAGDLPLPKQDHRPVSTKKENLRIEGKILITEDEYSNYLYLLEILSDFNITVLHAADGLESIEKVRSNADIDLVLMDLRLPVLSGFDAAREISKHHPGLPIIAQTAYIHDSEKKKAMDCGCVDFLSKPLSQDEIIQVLKKYLRKK